MKLSVSRCGIWVPGLLAGILLLVSAHATQDPDISGPWQVSDNDWLLLDRLSNGGWRLRQVSDGHRYSLTATDNTTYAVLTTSEHAAGEIAFDDNLSTLQWRRDDASAPVTARRLAITQHDFYAKADDGVKLRGRLSTPENTTPDHLVLLVHGSERTSAIQHFWYRDLFLAYGFSTIVFDKRGTGDSEGQFTMNFDRLAADVQSVALTAVESLDAPPVSLGLAGFSQGSWIAPLAAIDSPIVDYVLASYGLVYSPYDEAHELGMIELERAGLRGDELTSAEQLLTSALDIVACDYRCGWSAYTTLNDMHGDHGWLSHITDGRIQALLSEDEWRLRIYGQRHVVPLSWHYHSAPVLQHYAVPMAWLIAEDDSVAPPGFTMDFLNEMIEQGKPYVLHTYPETDHGILHFTETDGRRTYHNHDPRFLRDLVQEARRMSEIKATVYDTTK